MTPQEFVDRWKNADLSERSISQSHFLELCDLLQVPHPANDSSSDYQFEKAVQVTAAASKGSNGDRGFVDVWKKGCFAWEYKRKDKYKDLTDAYRQLYQYRDALENPPLSIVCDIGTTEIHTHFTGYPKEVHTVHLAELPSKLEVLRRAFTRPDSFRPFKNTDDTTQAVANDFAGLADRLLDRYPATGAGAVPPQTVAHFLMKIIFCLFAEDIGLLPADTFTRLVNRCLSDPDSWPQRAGDLFAKMRTGGDYGNDLIPYFNGGLFDTAPPLPLKHGDLRVLQMVAQKNWAGIEPSIFGTLFERLLDPAKRKQIGAHYTSTADILLVVEPVVMTPLRRKWAALQSELAPTFDQLAAHVDVKKRKPIAAKLEKQLDAFRHELASLRVLDPACGSGNFLYVALRQLLDLDNQIVRHAARFGLFLNPLPHLRPTQTLHGIEINFYAAELAQVVIWIGYLQWLHDRGIDPPNKPILDKLQSIENRDAILRWVDGKGKSISSWSEGAECAGVAEWPRADFIIGNPPFLGGGARMRNGLGNRYVEALYDRFDIPGTSDLCCYWFEIARSHLADETRVGLLATQGIRGKDNRTVLERAKVEGDIFLAWSDRNWVLEGADVHVSIVGFDNGLEKARTLDGMSVDEIHADLSTGTNLTETVELPENRGLQHEGDKKGAKFELTLDEAHDLLAAPNANGKHSLDVCRPWFNGEEIERSKGTWIIDFGTSMSQSEAAGYDAAFAIVKERVGKKYASKRKRWWLHERARPEMREALDLLPRFLVTVRHKPHRLFVWARHPALPDSAVVAFARSDDYFMGVLSSSVHVLWSRRIGTQVREKESGDRYVAACFETFPFPWPLAHSLIPPPAKTIN